jgi:hypothetical protein
MFYNRCPFLSHDYRHFFLCFVCSDRVHFSGFFRTSNDQVRELQRNSSSRFSTFDLDVPIAPNPNYLVDIAKLPGLHECLATQKFR